MAKQQKKKSKLTVFVIMSCISTLAYTGICLYGWLRNQTEPPMTLTTCFFAYWALENGFTTWIKVKESKHGIS